MKGITQLWWAHSKLPKARGIIDCPDTKDCVWAVVGADTEEEALSYVLPYSEGKRVRIELVEVEGTKADRKGLLLYDLWTTCEPATEGLPTLYARWMPWNFPAKKGVTFYTLGKDQFTGEDKYQFYERVNEYILDYECLPPTYGQPTYQFHFPHYQRRGKGYYPLIWLPTMDKKKGESNE